MFSSSNTIDPLARITSLSLGLMLAACAPSLNDDSDTDTDPPGPKVVVDGEFVIVDSRDAANYVYVSLSNSAEATPETPDDSTEWDLAFKRQTILVNGGINGTGSMEVLELDGADYEGTTQAPEGDYLTDTEDMDGDGKPDLAMRGWYQYNQSTHVLTPNDVFYAIRAVDGDYFKFQVLEYYDDAGTAGIMKLQWETVDSPEVDSNE